MNAVGFFLGVVVVFFAIWIATGGSSHPIALSGPTLPQYGIGAMSSTTASLAAPASLTAGPTLSRDTSGALASDPEKEYIAVILSSAAKDPVTLSGWRLASKETGASVVIPDGVLVPAAGRVNARGPVVLSPGDSALITTGESPVGISFKENLCTGYLDEHQEFFPTLTHACPTSITEFNRAFTGNDPNDECVAYLRSIPQCTTETHAPSGLSSSCERFIDETLTYEGCVAAHATDATFPGTTWRLFLGKSGNLWRDRHDTILLENPQGAVIDSLSY